MAKRRTSRRAAPRASSAYRPRTKRRSGRRNTLNASTKKKLAGLGMAAGVATIAAPIAFSAIKSRSTAPITSNLTNTGVLMEMGKRAIGGYAVGYAAGIVVDKTGIKRPVNKALKMVGMRRDHGIR